MMHCGHFADFTPPPHTHTLRILFLQPLRFPHLHICVHRPTRSTHLCTQSHTCIRAAVTWLSGAKCRASGWRVGTEVTGDALAFVRELSCVGCACAPADVSGPIRVFRSVAFLHRRQDSSWTSDIKAADSLTGCTLRWRSLPHRNALLEIKL